MKQQYDVALSSLLTTLPIINSYCEAAIYKKKINREQRTDRQKTEKPITEATLILMDHLIEQANTDSSNVGQKIDFGKIFNKIISKIKFLIN